MSDPSVDPDEELLERLRSAQAEQLPVPPTMLDLIMTGYDITNIDASVAALVEDASMAETGAVRDASDVRLLAFERDGFSIECELRGGDRRLLGHVDAAGPGALFVDGLEQSYRVEVDEIAGFVFTLTSGRPFRLRWEPDDGDTVVTEWVMP